MLVIILFFLALVNTLPYEDKVESLPDMNGGANFPFAMFSGYLQIPGSTRNLHYVYLES